MKNLLLSLFCAFTLLCSAQNQNLSNGVVFDGEPYLVVNPNNTQHIVVAWMGWKLNNLIVIKTRTSFDGGQTWSTTTNIPHVASGNQSADPSMAFNNNGDLFLCFIDYQTFPIAGAVYVSKSTDGGLNWGTPVEVINANSDGTQYPVDRPWMVIDNSGGANDGNIYITTMNPAIFGPVTPPYNPYFIRSTNGGASFEPWRYLDTANYLAGSLIPQPMPTPTVSANGTFHAVYPSYVISQSFFAQYFVASSSTAGDSFNYNVVLQTASTNSDTLPKKGYLLISNPANANHLLLAYPNFDNGDIDVYVTESLNAGLNWNTPMRVNDDPIANNRMQDLIWANFDNDGDVIVTWRDRRNSNDSTYTVSSEIYGAVLWKDSANFSSNFVISDSSVSYNTVLANSGNDFMCVSMDNDSISVVWGDTRNGFLNIWFQKMDLSTGTSSITDLANDVNPISVYPNPIEDFFTINFGENDLSNAKYEIYNVAGKLLISSSVTDVIQQVNISRLAKGNYLLKFSNNKGSSAHKIIKK